MNTFRLTMVIAVLGLGACATQDNAMAPAAPAQTTTQSSDAQATEASTTAEEKSEVICRRERQTGSNRARRVCYPASTMTSGDGAR
jgi:hypothetical protein